MKYIDFQNAFAEDIVIKKQSIDLLYPKFDTKSLSLWQKKGYIKKIRNGYYIFAKTKINTATLYHISNKVYHPSYISLHQWLCYYGFIPEYVFTITCVSTKKTNIIDCEQGDFSYQKIKNSLFWWYNYKKKWEVWFYIASPEKVLLDFFYLYPQYSDIEDMKWLRLNSFEILEKIDLTLLQVYLTNFENKRLEKTITIFLKYLKTC